MKIYHAGSAARELYDAGLRRPLLSFASTGARCFQFWVENGVPAQADVFLDSGAFTAYMHGKPVDLARYCAYIHEYGDVVTAYASLDVIGDWRMSAQNLDIMRAAGLKPVPTFHRGSPLSELDRLASEHAYIALGGLGDGTQKIHRQTSDNLSPYLDAVWCVLQRHWPIKVHVFGVAATQWVLERYPFYSADSATVSIGARLGTYARFSDGTIRWKYWWEDVPEVLDGVLSPEVPGNTTKSAREARCKRSLEALLVFERYITDVWTQRGVTWQ